MRWVVVDDAEEEERKQRAQKARAELRGIGRSIWKGMRFLVPFVTMSTAFWLFLMDNGRAFFPLPYRVDHMIGLTILSGLLALICCGTLMILWDELLVPLFGLLWTAWTGRPNPLRRIRDRREDPGPEF